MFRKYEEEKEEVKVLCELDLRTPDRLYRAV